MIWTQQIYPAWQNAKSPTAWMPPQRPPPAYRIPYYYNLAAHRHHHLGAEDGAPATSAQYTQVMATLLPEVLETVVSSGDPRVQVELYQAKIKNMKVMKRKLPALSFFYDNEIRKLEAKLRASEQKLAIKKSEEASSKTWHGVGLTAAGVAIAAGLGFTALLVAAATRAAKGSK